MQLLVKWWAEYPAELLEAAVVRPLQRYLTDELYATKKLTISVMNVIKVRGVPRCAVLGAQGSQALGAGVHRRRQQGRASALGMPAGSRWEARPAVHLTCSAGGRRRCWPRWRRPTRLAGSCRPMPFTTSSSGDCANP